MDNAKLKIDLYGNKLKDLHIIDLGIVPTSPISVSLWHTYTQQYLREDGGFQPQECLIECAFDQEKQAIILPVKPFEDLFLGDEIQLQLNAGNISKLWEYTNWPDLIGEPVTIPLLSEAFEPEPPQPAPPQPEPPQPGPPKQSKALVPLFLSACLFLALALLFSDNNFRFISIGKKACTTTETLDIIFVAISDDTVQCEKSMTCNDLLWGLKNTATDNPKHHIYLGEMFDDKTKSIELRKQFECPFAHDLPLAAEYYGTALVNGALNAQSLLNETCARLGPLDAAKASNWCEN
ncbi:hypothetical protein N9C56_10845 [Paracoccaceae bacterium]|nr:hypothetical protein [Paracoccaceae bacterium]